MPGAALGPGIVERDNYSEKQKDKGGGDIVCAMYLRSVQMANGL